ncbi:MAG TPA: hypothetical protein VFU63_10975 [Ktedonobacterales bacterium]|nr:hypothetical protein [Ktedonobacterales bacterium]
MYQVLVFLHILGVFGFLLAHGVSLFVGFRVQREKDIHAIRALLGLSASAVMASFFSLLVLLIGGIGAGVVGHWWSQGWIWAALGVFVLVWILMSAFTGPAFRRARLAAGFIGPRTIEESVTSEGLPEALAALQPWLPTLAGGIGLLVLLWLMVFKPF